MTTAPIIPRLLQARDAAAYVGLSVTKFRGLKLPARRHGGNVLWDRSDLDRFIDALPYDGEGADTTCAADEAWGG
ncbi:MAG: helix-turn-helix transcriptional regulator [Marinibacterium sp.]